MMLETLMGARWIRAKLLASSTITAAVAQRVYYRNVPQGVVYPYILIEARTAKDVRGNGPVRTCVNIDYVVRAIIDQTDYEDIEPIANEIDTVLNGAKGTTASATVLSCVRQFPFEMAENNLSIPYRHLGGQYWVMIQST